MSSVCQKYGFLLSVILLFTFFVFVICKPTNSDENVKDQIVNMQVDENAVPPVPPAVPEQANQPEEQIVSEHQADENVNDQNVNTQLDGNTVPPVPPAVPEQANQPVEQIVSDQQADTNNHDHPEGEKTECAECKEAEEKARQEAARKRLEDTKKFTEEAQRNVHDARSRAVAEELKHRPFESGNMEELMHGGHHVHGEGHDQNEKAAGVDMSEIMGKAAPKPEKKVEEPGFLDPESLMHGGGEDHDHGNPHEDNPAQEVKSAPGAQGPEDLLEMSHRQDSFGPDIAGLRADGADEILGKANMRHLDDLENPDTDDNAEIGVNVERMVHGDDHVHDHAEVTEEVTDEDGNVHVKKLGKKITYDDIIALGLSKDDLEGIDIGKLLTDNEDEYQEWQNEVRKADESGQMSFWEQVDDLRRRYFGSGSKKVKDISKADAEDVEWEKTDGDDDDRPHEGESDIEHEMEMWASTQGKNARRPYKEIRGEDL